MTTPDPTANDLLHSLLGYPEKYGRYLCGHAPDVRDLSRIADSILVLFGPGVGDMFSSCQTAIAQVGSDTLLARAFVANTYPPWTMKEREQRASGERLGRCCSDAVAFLAGNGFFSLPAEVGDAALDSPSVTAFAWSRGNSQRVTFDSLNLRGAEARMYRRLLFLLHAPVWRLRLGQFFADGHAALWGRP